MKEQVETRPKFTELSSLKQVDHIMEKRTPKPEQVTYTPTVEFLDQEGRLTREERGKVIAMGDRTAISYRNLTEQVINDRGKTVEVEGEEVEKTANFYMMYALAARSSKEIAHTSILEQVNVGEGEWGGDAPITIEGVSILTGLRDIASLRHFAFEAFSSRGGVFPEGYWRIPSELRDAGVGQELESINQEIYDIYIDLTRKGIKHHLQTSERKEGETLWQWQWRVLNLSLDESRQVTNSSFLNHLSMHPNSALSLREGLVKLSASELPETRAIAARIRGLVSIALPNLMRHTEASPYTQSLPEKRRKISGELGLGMRGYDPEKVEQSRFLDATITPEADRLFLAAFIANRGEVSFEEALEAIKQTPDEQVDQHIEEIFSGISLHDKPPEELELVQVRANFEMSVGAVYEAIRHRLATHLVADFTPYHGYTIPETYRRLGLEKEFQRGMELNLEAYALVEDLGPEYARVFGPHFVARAHLGPATMRMSGLDVFHILKIRATKKAHPDISNPMLGLEQFLRQDGSIFKHLVKKA